MDLNLQKQLDLRKDIVLNLKKELGLKDQKAQVVLALDYSGSMGNLYRSGKVQQLVERILPLGLGFDDNGEVDFYLFHHGVIQLPTPITLKNVQGYIDNKVMGKYDMGGTNYEPVITEIIKDFGKKKSGLMGMFSKNSGPLDYPVYVIFITDGDNADRKETEKAIIEASKTGIFFQFVGIGSERFQFLQKLDDLSGRNIDNANFFKVPDLSQVSDNELYSLLLPEFPSYIQEARNKNLIK